MKNSRNTLDTISYVVKQGVVCASMGYMIYSDDTQVILKGGFIVTMTMLAIVATEIERLRDQPSKHEG